MQELYREVQGNEPKAEDIYGICRLCGENKELTFEYVPPETVFNKGAVRNVCL